MLDDSNTTECSSDKCANYQSLKSNVCYFSTDKFMLSFKYEILEKFTICYAEETKIVMKRHGCLVGIFVCDDDTMEKYKVVNNYFFCKYIQICHYY